MPKIKNLTVDQVVYSIERGKMGHTSVYIRRLYEIKITEVDPDHKWVMGSWNGNTPRKFTQSSANRWRVNRPQPVKTIMGMKSY